MTSKTLRGLLAAGIVGLAVALSACAQLGALRNDINAIVLNAITNNPQ